MTKKTDTLNSAAIKNTVIAVLIICAAFIIYKTLVVRTVNYEIGGIIIPSRYNILTGRAAPITDYAGSGSIPVVASKKTDNIGLSKDNIVMAKLRWAVFEQWANSRQEYTGWENDAEIFKKAHDVFRQEIESHGPKFKVIK